MKKVLNVEEYELKQVIEEASLLSYLDCDEIVKCNDLYYHKRVVYIFLEFMEQSSLTKMIKGYKNEYSEEFCKYSLYKAALGLKKMHENNVLHRDIKSDNILHSLDGGEVKLADLGFACTLDEKKKNRKTKMGTPNWIAPEICNNVQYGKSVDIWSFGCFAHELATGMPPFHKIRNRSRLFKEIINVDVPEIQGDRWSDDFKDFVKMCLKRDPEERLNINRVLSSRFLASLDDEQCRE